MRPSSFRTSRWLASRRPFNSTRRQAPRAGRRAGLVRTAARRTRSCHALLWPPRGAALLIPAAERAVSRASSHSSSSSNSSSDLPDLIPVSPSPEPRAAVQAQDRLRRRLAALDVDAVEGRWIRPREERIPFTRVLDLILAAYGRTTVRGNYPAWRDFPGLRDSYSACELVSQLVREVVAAEPFYHPDSVPPLGQVVFDHVRDCDAVLAMIDCCDRSVAARKILSRPRNWLYLARRRVSALYDSGAYFDEKAGCIARDVAPAADHPIRRLDARDVTHPLTHVIRYLEAVSEMVEQSADPLMHHE